MKNAGFLSIMLLLISSFGLTDTPAGVKPAMGRDLKMTIKKVPILVGKEENDLMYINISVDSTFKKPVSVTRVRIKFSKSSNPENLVSVNAYFYHEKIASDKKDLFGKVDLPKLKNNIKGNSVLRSGINTFIFSFHPKAGIEYTDHLLLTGIELSFSDKTVKIVEIPSDIDPWRFGLVLRKAGQDNCDTYRIPGLVTTNKGTLIAVYDNRYKDSKDLQNDIDVGMSRSEDGGNTWEPMKVIIDMKEWGGRPESENGIGDPCVFMDRSNNNIWVAGLWAYGNPGKHAAAVSGPGLKPEETGQLVLVKSEDDGITWSPPANITPSVKNPAWHLMMQGPGMGITINDGTIVFPARINNADKVPYSTIYYSKDHGNTWHIGTGAKSGTSEAQCVQLTDGSIMLNMRDNRNSKEKGETNGRAVAVTTDLGTSWTVHPSSNSALPESVCMASLISTEIVIEGQTKRILLFSNPNDKYKRINMTIKASLDEGLTWPEKYQVLLDESEGYGYSCLTMVDDQTVGILYEGEKDLYFQKILLKDIIGDVYK